MASRRATLADRVRDSYVSSQSEKPANCFLTQPDRGHMAYLEVLEHREVYRNPHANLRSEYVAFPSIQVLPDDTLLCMCRHASARESDDGVVVIHRSADGGVTWERAGDLPQPPDTGVGFRIPGGFGVTAQGEVIACVRYPGSEVDGQLVARSRDRGDTWSPLDPIDSAPFDRMGPGGNLVTMADGTLIAAGEWGEERDDDEPPDWAATITRSQDGGHSWESWRRIQGPADTGLYFFDLRLARLADDRLLAAFWTHDLTKDEGVNVHTSFSLDAGATWSDPRAAGFWGQVTDIHGLQSGRVIAVTNHRREPMGVRAVLSDDGGASFAEEHHVELWGIEPARVRNAPVLSKKRDLVESVLDSYHHFTFGTPSVTQLSDGIIVAAFYVTEEHVTYVRCCRMAERD